ncbi:MAG: hypothetical protein J3R72DRAFT_443623, partial [Linnemannia gamsii]
MYTAWHHCCLFGSLLFAALYFFTILSAALPDKDRAGTAALYCKPVDGCIQFNRVIVVWVWMEGFSTEVQSSLSLFLFDLRALFFVLPLLSPALFLYLTLFCVTPHLSLSLPIASLFVAASSLSLWLPLFALTLFLLRSSIALLFSSLCAKENHKTRHNRLCV